MITGGLNLIAFKVVGRASRDPRRGTFEHAGAQRRRACDRPVGKNQSEGESPDSGIVESDGAEPSRRAKEKRFHRQGQKIDGKLAAKNTKAEKYVLNRRAGLNPPLWNVRQRIKHGMVT